MTSFSNQPFWNIERYAPFDELCTDGDRTAWTAQVFDRLVQDFMECLHETGERRLGFILSDNSISWLVTYVACLRAGHVPLLLPAKLDAQLLERLRNEYSPAWTWRASDSLTSEPRRGEGLTVHRQRDSPTQLHPELALLLSTSGSTGSPRLVRIAYRALQANAESIASYLGITPSERALTTLPPSYSYGLSVINSHLQAGAPVVLRNTSPFDPDFFSIIRRERITSLAGVPSWYKMLLRVGLEKQVLPSLRVLTQAGGHLDTASKQRVAAFAESCGVRFYVMYGQTEATARIAFVPPSLLSSNIESIGQAIPGGHLEIDPDTTELIYRGPNVMMGYAEVREDLNKGDELSGVLRTGDLAVSLASGLFAITGRAKRFIKISGLRFGLDEIESAVTSLTSLPTAVDGRDDRLTVWLEGASEQIVCDVRRLLTSTFRIHHSHFSVNGVAAFPLLPSGKTDYEKLRTLLP